MIHLNKKFRHYMMKNRAYFITLTSLVCAVVILSGTFLLTRGATPHISELAFTEQSILGKQAGSVIPASCESEPFMVANGDGNFTDCATITCSDGTVIIPAMEQACWTGPVLKVGDINAKNVAFGKPIRAIASAPTSLWRNFSETFVRIAKAAGHGPYANLPMELSSMVTNSGGATSVTFTNTFYVDIHNDNNALQPGVTTGWDVEDSITMNGLGAGASELASVTIRGNKGDDGAMGLPMGTHAIVFCSDVNTQVSDPAQPLSARCSDKIVQDRLDNAPCYGQGCTGTGTGVGTCNYPSSSQPTVNIPAQCCSTTPGVCPALPVVTSFSANPSTIDTDQTTKLFWSSTGATSCTAGSAPSCNQANGFNANCATVNSTGADSIALTVDPSAFSITCIGPGGSSFPKTTSVKVLFPSATISANPTRLASGGKTTIKWEGTSVKSCLVSGTNGFSGNGLLNPTLAPQSTIVGQTIFTITCLTNDPAKPKTASVTVNVVPVYQEF